MTFLDGDDLKTSIGSVSLEAGEHTAKHNEIRAALRELRDELLPDKSTLTDGDLLQWDASGDRLIRLDSGTYLSVADAIANYARLPLDEVFYNPATTTVLDTPNTTSEDVEATNLAVSFTAPDSGQVYVTLEAVGDSGTAGVTYLWHLRDGSGEITGTGAVVTRNNNAARLSYRILVTGLTAGNIYTWKWGHKVGSAATGRIICGDPYGPARMTVEAA